MADVLVVGFGAAFGARVGATLDAGVDLGAEDELVLGGVILLGDTD